MKTKAISIALSALLLTGCTSSQFAGVATGSSLGAMLGSSIGGILSGPRGSDVGTLIGMVAGGAAGAAIANHADKSSSTSSSTYSDDSYYSDNTYYSNGSSSRYRQPTTRSQWANIEVSNIRLIDSNNDGRLSPGEHAYISMELRNRGSQTIYDVAPIVECSNRHVTLSPRAVIGELDTSRGIRYKVEVIAPRRLRDSRLTFRVYFSDGRQTTTAKTFAVPVRQQ